MRSVVVHSCNAVWGFEEVVLRFLETGCSVSLLDDILVKKSTKTLNNPICITGNNCPTSPDQCSKNVVSQIGDKVSLEIVISAERNEVNKRVRRVSSERVLDEIVKRVLVNSSDEVVESALGGLKANEQIRGRRVSRFVVSR